MQRVQITMGLSLVLAIKDLTEMVSIAMVKFSSGFENCL